VFGEILADERDERELGDLDELDRAARHFHCLPPANVGMKHATQVVLVDLAFVERPAVMFVLTEVEPRPASGGRRRLTLYEHRVPAVVNPVGREPPSLGYPLADAGVDEGDSVAAQQVLEVVDVALVDGALG